MTEVFDETKEHVRAGIITKPSTVNQEYFQAMIRNRSANFKFPVLKNFIASAYEELAKAGKEETPEGAANSVYRSAVMLAYPVISMKRDAMKANKTFTPRLEEIYQQLKKAFSNCPEYSLKIEKKDSGANRVYEIKLNHETYMAYPENLDSVVKYANEANKHKLNCDTSKTFTLCVLMLMELNLISLDYSIDIMEEPVYDSESVKGVLRKHGRGDQ